MDNAIGDMVLRGRGDAERARTFLRRVRNATFGGIEMCCTVTPGGGPNLRTKEALSSMVPSAAKGELTDADCSGEFTEGEDIFHCKNLSQK